MVLRWETLFGICIFIIHVFIPALIISINTPLLLTPLSSHRYLFPIFKAYFEPNKQNGRNEGSDECNAWVETSVVDGVSADCIHCCQCAFQTRHKRRNECKSCYNISSRFWICFHCSSRSRFWKVRHHFLTSTFFSLLL